jgi:hypothetical protein
MFTIHKDALRASETKRFGVKIIIFLSVALTVRFEFRAGMCCCATRIKKDMLRKPLTRYSSPARRPLVWLMKDIHTHIADINRT